MWGGVESPRPVASMTSWISRIGCAAVSSRVVMAPAEPVRQVACRLARSTALSCLAGWRRVWVGASRVGPVCGLDPATQVTLVPGRQGKSRGPEVTVRIYGRVSRKDVAHSRPRGVFVCDYWRGSRHVFLLAWRNGGFASACSVSPRTVSPQVRQEDVLCFVSKTRGGPRLTTT